MLITVSYGYPVTTLPPSLFPVGNTPVEIQVLGHDEAENERPDPCLALSTPGVPFLLCFGILPESNYKLLSEELTRVIQYKW